jgi:hypothetical protein
LDKHKEIGISFSRPPFLKKGKGQFRQFRKSGGAVTTGTIWSIGIRSTER